MRMKDTAASPLAETMVRWFGQVGSPTRTVAPGVRVPDELHVQAQRAAPARSLDRERAVRLERIAEPEHER